MKIENKNNKLPFNRRRREITNLVGIIVILLFLLMVFWLYLEQAVTARFALFLALGLLWGLFSMIKELYKWNMLVFAVNVGINSATQAGADTFIRIIDNSNK